jgi:hypothetical protein
MDLARGIERDLLVHALDALFELAGVEPADVGAHRECLLRW